MKEQRFEKVVKWETKPNKIEMIISLIFGIFTIAVNLYTDDIWLRLASLIGFVYCIVTFFLSLGEGRKVYWRKIK